MKNRVLVFASVAFVSVLAVLLLPSCGSCGSDSSGQEKAVEPSSPATEDRTATKPTEPSVRGTQASSEIPTLSRSKKNMAGPVPARKGLAEDGSMQTSPEDRCPVCGMAIDEHKKFASAIELTDGTTYHFCGTGCMLRSWLRPDYHLHRKPTDLKRAVTKDYFHGKTLDASKATFVTGSDVIGPMGPAIVPLENANDVAAFKARHGGKHEFKLEELTEATWETITGKQAAPTKKP